MFFLVLWPVSLLWRTFQRWDCTGVEIRVLRTGEQGQGIPRDWIRRRFCSLLWHSLPAARQESKQGLEKGGRESLEVEFQLDMGLQEEQGIPALAGIQNW